MHKYRCSRLQALLGLIFPVLAEALSASAAVASLAARAAIFSCTNPPQRLCLLWRTVSGHHRGGHPREVVEVETRTHSLADEREVVAALKQTAAFPQPSANRHLQPLASENVRPKNGRRQLLRRRVKDCVLESAAALPVDCSGRGQRCSGRASTSETRVSASKRWM